MKTKSDKEILDWAARHPNWNFILVCVLPCIISIIIAIPIALGIWVLSGR